MKPVRRIRADSRRPLVLIGADVDPRISGMRRPSWDPWDPLEQIANLESALGNDLPAITWLIRADDTIRQLTGSFESGYLSRWALWERLQSRNHEMGWHFHHWTFRESCNVFDPDPQWLGEAYQALSRYFPVLSTRMGWDYANNAAMRKLELLGVCLDFSALPGHIVWVTMEGKRILVDWRHCGAEPYHPSAADYQTPGASPLRLWEVPICSFPADAATAAKRILWRAAHGEYSFRGLFNKTRVLTASWRELPPRLDVLAFYFHPEELTGTGIANFINNVAKLREQFDPEFVTGQELASRLSRRDADTNICHNTASPCSSNAGDE